MGLTSPAPPPPDSLSSASSLNHPQTAWAPQGRLQAREQGRDGAICQARLLATMPASTLTLIHIAGLESESPVCQLAATRVYSDSPGLLSVKCTFGAGGRRASRPRLPKGQGPGGQDRGLGPPPAPFLPCASGCGPCLLPLLSCLGQESPACLLLRLHPSLEKAGLFPGQNHRGATYKMGNLL